MKILVLAPFLPYPDAHSGNPRAVFDRIRLLSGEHSLTVATFVEPGDKASVLTLKDMEVRVYGVTRHLNASRSGRGLWRKRARLALGLLDPSRPMLVQEFYDRRMVRLVSGLLQRQRFDVVMVEHILMAQYTLGRSTRLHPPTVLTEHDVRLAFPTSNEGKPEGLPGRLLSLLHRYDRARWRRYERACCRRAAAVIVPSAEDAGVLSKEVPGLEPYVVPFGIAPAVPHQATAGEPEQADSVLFVGNYSHPPNVDAALWLCREIMPLVWRERAGVELLLVGKDPTPQVYALAGPRVTVTGEVPSVLPYLQRCSLFVAPLREGGGTRIKILEALEAGAAVITTSLGARGLGVVEGRDLLVADDAAGFAAAVFRALDDPALRASLRQAGQALAGSRESETERLAKLNSILRSVVSDRGE